ncbi:DUF2680 domain-containing protein [Thermovenabulum sp.]|uniref:DUF2680 domain-containing protein n=1 Tax=Thermovenabulum sp. TaxID=3100335 RepID=UPI003C7D5124
MKKQIAFLILVVVLLASTVAFAATTTSPANLSSGVPVSTLNLARGYGAQFMSSIVAKLTGLKTEDVLALRAQGQTFYQIAVSKGVTVENFKEAVYKEKASLVDQKVKEGIFTKEQADEIKANLKSRIDNCNGQGYTNRPQSGLGLFGKGGGIGNRTGQGQGMRGFWK